ncbi:DUF3077 domain-containing protein [Pseudomonas sp.]|uniref:DUF3077 domain-containing protein n=1 Tax=Pseudomonas sp. TaxID=306 RepID=UPI003BAEF3BC
MAAVRGQTSNTAGVVNFIRSEQSPMGLFRIAPGVPCDYALEQASTVVGAAVRRLDLPCDAM